MVAKVGKDNFGQEILANFERKGVDTMHVSQTSNTSTGLANILVNESGENCIIIIPGANHELTIEDIGAAQEVITNAKVLLTQLEIQSDVTFEALKLAHSAGVLTILNPAPACAIPDCWYPHIDILCPNESELQILTKKVISNREDALEAATELIEKYHFFLCVVFCDVGGDVDNGGSFYPLVVSHEVL
eukprot:TRINITY_DN2569_c0_g3_i12.p1 TRINITY_DN2569_c0_g3~~TRINITY_DN2569_c0_g3_i12.p1  ORF type:complete len:209 (+),score=37.98 TRINITY_DN2569_c0_g3_i12:63-629(+)